MRRVVAAVPTRPWPRPRFWYSVYSERQHFEAVGVFMMFSMASSIRPDRRILPASWRMVVVTAGRERCHHMCRQSFLSLILWKCSLWIWNSPQIESMGRPAAMSRRISKTCPEVRRAFPFLSPGFTRCFRAASAKLSAIVPSHRWAGFTHGGRSQA